MLFALFLASCSMGSPIVPTVPWPYVPLCLSDFLTCIMLLLFLLFFLFLLLLLPPGVCGFPFYLGYSPIELWDSLSSYAHPRIACLASQASDWLGAFWASLSGLQPSMALVKLLMIGLSCDHLVGALNYLASTSCLINCALTHSSNGFRLASGRHKA